MRIGQRLCATVFDSGKPRRKDVYTAVIHFKEHRARYISRAVHLEARAAA